MAYKIWTTLVTCKDLETALSIKQGLEDNFMSFAFRIDRDEEHNHEVCVLDVTNDRLPELQAFIWGFFAGRRSMMSERSA